MWIVPPLVCLVGIGVAFLPEARPTEEPHRSRNDSETTWASAPLAFATVTTLAVMALVLYSVLAA